MDLQLALSKYPDKETLAEITSYIGDEPDRFAELIDLVLHGERTVSQYASWLVSPCIDLHPFLIRPHLQELIENLSRPNLSDWVIRSTIKALMKTDDLSEEHQGLALQHCFDYLLNPKMAVSIHVYAMQTAFNISQNEPDLLNELKMVIEERLPYGTAAYKSRGKKIVGEIKKKASFIR